MLASDAARLKASGPCESAQALRYWVGLGANQGDPVAQLRAAIEALRPYSIEGRLRSSSLWESEAVDGPGPNYINAVIQFSSHLGVEALLDVLQAIELQFGRQRSSVNAPRPLDLDILLAEDLQVAQSRLQIPHPRMHQRAFVLYPLLELDPGLRIPGLGPASQWLKACSDQVCRLWRP